MLIGEFESLDGNFSMSSFTTVLCLCYASKTTQEFVNFARLHRQKA